MDLAKYAEQVDEAREKVIQGDPERAKVLGVEMPKDPAIAKAEAEIDAIDGLDAETRKALKIPAVRKALDEEFTRTETAQRGYTEALSHANNYSHAAILAIAPELQGVPLERWAEGVQILAQSDPVRGQQLGNLLAYVGNIQQAQQQQVMQQKQNLEQWVKAEDAKLEVMIGKKTSAERAQFADDLVKYANELGVSRAGLVDAIQSQPVLLSAPMQRMMWDALQYRKITSAPKAHPTRAVPSAQKPGSSATPRASENSSKIQNLQRQLSSATGDRAARIAAEIRNIRRKSA